MSAEAGTLGRYQIIREVARSNDIVYEAYDPAMNRRLALKELKVPGGATEKQRRERLARFRREAKAAGSLTHTNIVTVYEVGESDGRAFIAMEYLEGQSLRKRVDAEGLLPQEEIGRIMLEVLDGLAYAHDKGVVHRDIKPANIQLLPGGRVVITDFGIARLMFEPSLTADGQIFGTPSYMSPEQVVGRDIDARTDIWSCGVVLYEAISGQKAFKGDNVVAISNAIMHQEPPDPPQASYSIAQVIRRAIEKAPDERYASAEALAKELREALKALKEDPAIASQQPFAAQPKITTPWGSPLDPYGPPQQQPPAQPPPPGPAPPPYPPQPGSPYGQPYGQPYGTPYGQQTPGATPLPPPPVPLGWTSPPRRPILSPEVSEFLRRTFWVIVIGGAIIALMFAGVYGLMRVADRFSANRMDQRFAGNLESASAITNTDPQRALEDLLAIEQKLHSEEMVAEVSKQLARAYSNLGRRAVISGDWGAAKQYFDNATNRDGTDAYSFAESGKVCKELVQFYNNPSDRIALLKESADRLETAIQLEKNERILAEYLRETADTLILLARELRGQNQNASAELALQNALSHAQAAGAPKEIDDARGMLSELP